MAVRAKVLTGSSDEGVDGLKVLAIQVLAQAVRDARCRNPRLQHDALDWLNAPEGRGLADALGVKRWANKQQITWGDLPGRVRDTWFLGGCIMIALARWLLRHELQAHRMETAAARLAAENAELQLTVLRAMYAGLLKECDSHKARADHLASDLASLKRRRRREVHAARTWITRTIQPHVSEN